MGRHGVLGKRGCNGVEGKYETWGNGGKGFVTKARCNGVEGEYETWDDGEKRGMYYRRGNGVEGKYETCLGRTRDICVRVTIRVGRYEARCKGQSVS